MRKPRLAGRLAAAVCALATAGVPAGPASADWIRSALDQRCAAEDIDGITSSIRDAIEASVRRAEASIEAPHAIGDLSCLNDLMNAPLDIFSNLGGILGNLQGGLTNLVNFDIDLDVSGMICDFAARKWAELTGGLGGFDIDLSGFANTLANPVQRLTQGGGFGGSGSLGGFSGSTRTNFSNAPTGTSWTPIPVPGRSDPDIFRNDEAMLPAASTFDQTAFNRALAQHEADVWNANNAYIGCLAARDTLLSLAPILGFPTTIPTCTPPSHDPAPDPDNFIIAGLGGPAQSPLPAPTFTTPSGPGGSSTPIAPSQLLPSLPSGQSGGGTGNAVDSIWDSLMGRP